MVSQFFIRARAAKALILYGKKSSLALRSALLVSLFPELLFLAFLAVVIFIPRLLIRGRFGSRPQCISCDLVKLAQQFLCLMAQLIGNLHHQCHIVVSPDILVSPGGHTLAAQPYSGIRLCPRLYIINDLSVHRVNQDLSAQRRPYQAYSSLSSVS